MKKILVSVILFNILICANLFAEDKYITCFEDSAPYSHYGSTSNYYGLVIKTKSDGSYFALINKYSKFYIANNFKCERLKLNELNCEGSYYKTDKYFTDEHEFSVFLDLSSDMGLSESLIGQSQYICVQSTESNFISEYQDHIHSNVKSNYYRDGLKVFESFIKR